MGNQEPLPRDEVYDLQEGVEGTQRPAWDIVRMALLALAVVMLLLGLMWVAELVGLLALLVPGGWLDVFGGAAWAFVGLLGLVLLLLVLFRR